MRLRPQRIAYRTLEVPVSDRCRTSCPASQAVGQEWSSGSAHQLAQAIDRITSSATGYLSSQPAAQRVGTGLNAPPDFGPQIAAEIASATGYPFRTAAN
jgi:fumarate hydratase class II